jgi:hypothetical protein
MLRVLLFVVFALIVFAAVRSNIENRPNEAVANEAALAWTLRALGGLTAAVAAFALLLRALGGEAAERQLGLVLPLVGGLALSTGTWAAPLGLAIVGAALIAREVCGRTSPPQS